MTMLIMRLFCVSCATLSLLASNLSIGSAQSTPQIESGSTVYILPAAGYEVYLAAAFAKKHVPLTVVYDQDKANYLIVSNVEQRDPTSPSVVVNNNYGALQNGIAQSRRDFGHTTSSMQVIDVKSSQICFAYSVGKGTNTNQIQSTAEASAKHLRDLMAKEK